MRRREFITVIGDAAAWPIFAHAQEKVRRVGMQRREFITLLGGAAATWPAVVHAQQPMPTIGFLRSAPLADATHLVSGFRQGLKEAGFVEGQNVAIEYRSAENQHDRLPALVNELIHRPSRRDRRKCRCVGRGQGRNDNGADCL